MTNAELDELLSDCPTLFHMAEFGSWSSIQKHGLLSTSALLDLYGIVGREREKIEAQRRPSSVPLLHPTLPRAVVRDQIPMDDKGLVRCLPAHLAPQDWYKILNEKVFFWLTRERLSRLLGADAYREKEHDVLELSSRDLVKAYHKDIWLCPMNSGNTKPMPHPRDETTFSRVEDYPYASWRKKRKKGERVVELAVSYSVPDVSRFVTRVVRMRGDNETKILFAR